jgi:hypothetical protein
MAASTVLQSVIMACSRVRPCSSAGLLDQKDQSWHTCHTRWWSSSSTGFPTPNPLAAAARCSLRNEWLTQTRVLAAHERHWARTYDATAYADMRKRALRAAGNHGEGKRLAALLCHEKHSSAQRATVTRASRRRG